MTSADLIRPAEPWAELGVQARALAERLRAVAQDQAPATSAACLSYSQIVDEIARVAESGGEAPTARRLGSLMTAQQRQEFGKLLRDRRNQAGFSRVQLGRKAKLSDATLKFIETARHPPSRATVLRLLAVPELKLRWADVPGSITPPQEPTGEGAEPDQLAELHRLDPRLQVEAVRELSVLADELGRHQYQVERTHYGCSRVCRLCGARSEGAAMDAQQAHKLKLRHAPLCIGQLAETLLRQHPVISELATAERRHPRTATAYALAEGIRLATLLRFYGCRSGAEIAAQLAHNAALPPSPYCRGIGSLLLWALGLGPCPVEPAEPFSEDCARRLVMRLKRSAAQPSELGERLRGVSHAAAWLLDENASEPRDPALFLAPEPPATDALTPERQRAPHG